MRKIVLLLLVLLLGVTGIGMAQDATTVAVMTPFLAQPGTQIMVENFEASAMAKGWNVNVIDTNEDIAALVSRMEDVSLQGVDAIVINVDPTQIEAGLYAAVDAGIPVFGLDSGAHPLLVTNVTSNGYTMAAETATYVVDRLNAAGDVIMFIFEPYPPVQKRGAIARAIFENTADINIADAITPSFDNGPLEGARNAMEAVLLANPDAGSISAVWSAWDDPALGALQAIEDAGRADEGIVIVGIDATEQARDAIARGSNFEATVAQDFAGMAQKVADLVESHLGGAEITQVNHYVPAKLVTQADLSE